MGYVFLAIPIVFNDLVGSTVHFLFAPQSGSFLFPSRQGPTLIVSGSIQVWLNVRYRLRGSDGESLYAGASAMQMFSRSVHGARSIRQFADESTMPPRYN